MAADDEKTPDPDPWADIVADGLDADEEITLQFTADERPDGEPPAAADAPPAASGEDDQEVHDWLAEPEAERPAAGAEPALPFEADRDAVGDVIDIGTGIEGLEADSEAVADAAADDLLAAVENEAAEADPWGDFGTPTGGEAGEVSTAVTADAEEDAGEFPVTAPDADDAAAAPIAAPPAAAPRGRKPTPRKQAGGIGQMIGVVAGGALAIPITLGILIWGLQKDPFGIAKMVPEQAAFLLPQKFRPGSKKSKAAPGRSSAPGGSPLDAVATTGAAPSAEPPAGETSSAPGDVPAADLPMPDLGDLATDASTEAAAPADVPGGDATGFDEALNESPSDAGAGVDAGVASGSPATPGLDDLASLAPSGLDSLPAAPAAPAEPAPLDTAELDAALAEAGALGSALAAVEDRTTRPAKLLLAQWYQAVARVAERLASLERTAADSGRPLAGAPEQVAAFHAALVGDDVQAADLARVAWDWLAYSKRQGDGVVLPVTFESARRLGPYWSATATLEKGDGTQRVLSIVSRAEPSAVAGDRLLVTGLVLGDGVIWAADWHATGGGAAEPAAEPEPAFPAAPF